MAKKTKTVKFLELAKQQAQESYNNPDFPFSTACGAGMLLGRAFDGNRESILRAAAEALEDWNFHNDAARLREMAGDTATTRVADHILCS